MEIANPGQRINAASNSAENKYINSIDYNGKAYDKNWLSHSLLVEGGSIDFKMSATPNKARGILKEDFPYSFFGK